MFPLNIYSFLNDPIQYFYELRDKYGDPFPLSFPGNPTVWLTSHPENAKAIFTAPADSFKTSEHNPVGPLLGPSGLIMLSGQEHLEQRKEFSPHFSKKNLNPFAEAIQNIFLDIHHSHEAKGILHLQDFAEKSTLKIILKFLFPKLTAVELLEAEELTDKFLKSYSASYLFIPKWVPGTWGNFTEKKEALDDQFYQYFLSTIDSGAITPLMGLKSAPKEKVMDHIRTFIVAGHETSATTLTWAIFYIHKIHFVKNRLSEELKIFSNLSDADYLENLLTNDYLDAVVSESLRIQPPVPFVTRKIINRSFNLGERTFEMGEELGVCITLLHRDEFKWKNPTVFRPERFANHKYGPFEFAPFGGGLRKCIGAELAVLELKILIGQFIRHYDSFLLEASTPFSEIKQITAGPKRRIELAYTKVLS